MARKSGKCDEMPPTPGYFALLEPWYRAAGHMAANVRGEFFAALADYFFTGERPPDGAPYLAAFDLIAPSIEATAKRARTSAARSAAAMARWNAKANANPMQNKEKRESEEENGKERSKEKGKEEEKERREHTHLRVCDAHTKQKRMHTFRGSAEPPTLEKISSWCASHFSLVPPAVFVEDFHRRMTEGGWTGRNGGNLLRGARWRRELSAWWAQEQKNSRARASSSGVSGGFADTSMMNYTED